MHAAGSASQGLAIALVFLWNESCGCLYREAWAQRWRARRNRRIGAADRPGAAAGLGKEAAGPGQAGDGAGGGGGGAGAGRGGGDGASGATVTGVGSLQRPLLSPEVRVSGGLGVWCLHACGPELQRDLQASLARRNPSLQEQVAVTQTAHFVAAARFDAPTHRSTYDRSMV
jgi:hypothetical protein